MPRNLIVVLLFTTAAFAQTPAPDLTPSADDIARAISADANANKAQAHSGTDASAGQGPGSPSASGLMAVMPRSFQSLNPDLALIADFAVAGFNPRGMQMLGGHDPKQNGFNFQLLELALGAAVDPYFRFDSNIVFTPAGVEVEEAYGTTLALPGGMQVRAGKFLTRFGRFNPTHPHSWNFSDQPVVLSRFFGGEGNRGIGLEVSDLLLFLPWYVEVVLSATDPREPGASVSFADVHDGNPWPAIHGAQDLEYLGAVKQFFPLSDDVSLSWGLSGVTAPNFANGRTEIYGTDFYLKYRPVGQAAPPIIALHVEGLLRRFEDGAGKIYVDSGAFAQLLYRFSSRWAAAAGAEYVTSASGYPVALAKSATGEDLVGETPGVTQRYKADLSFYPTEFSRLRLQYDVEPSGATHARISQGLFLNVEFAIGAHGAHAF